MKNTAVLLGLSISILSLFACSNTEPHNEKQDTLSAASKDQHKMASTNSPRTGGKYEFGEDIEKGPIGLVSVYPLTDTTALFYLDVNRGAPSYNMGLLAGQMKISNNIGIYNSKSTDNEKGCVIKFTFGNNKLEVSTDAKKDDCGFGFNVYADNTYKLVDSKIPEFYISGEGDTILFKDLKIK